MEEIKEVIQCNICNEINDIDTHYCKKCGRNLSNKFEFTDLLFGVSKIIKVISYFSFSIVINFITIDLFMIIIMSLINRLILNLNLEIRLKFIKNTIVWFILGIVFYFLGCLLKKITLKLCEKNLE